MSDTPWNPPPVEAVKPDRPFKMVYESTPNAKPGSWAERWHADMDAEARKVLERGWLSPLTYPRPIPVSERLPDAGERVQWWVCGGDNPRWLIGSFHAASIPDFMNVKLDDECYVPGEPRETVFCAMNTFSHWLPLPPPVE